MSALDQLEAFLQGLMERPAGLLMPKGLRAVQLVSALTKALEGSALRLTDRIVIPSEYGLSISPEDYSRFSDVRPTLERELAAYVERLASERELSLPADPEVHIRAAPDVSPGRVHVEALFPPASAQHNSGPPRRNSPAERGPALALLTPDGRPIRHFPLDGPSVTLGRRSSNDITLPDLKISRQHARFDGNGEVWYLTDLRSTNGTRLNGRDVVEQSRLSPGDIIELGLQRLRFEALPKAQGSAN